MEEEGWRWWGPAQAVRPAHARLHISMCHDAAPFQQGPVYKGTHVLTDLQFLSELPQPPRGLHVVQRHQ